MTESKPLPSFNGWRALAILLVMASHAWFTAGFPAVGLSRSLDGNLGVRFFFTISGFLITWLMVREEKYSAAVTLKNFYARRALRILPVYLAWLVMTACLQLAGVSRIRSLLWLQLLTFTRNFYQTGAVECPSSFHVWSLCVEEQFYLAWPLFFCLFNRSTGKRAAFLVSMMMLSTAWKLIALLGWHDRHLSFLFESYSTFFYLDCLAYGCLAAIFLAEKEAALRMFFQRYPAPIFLLSISLIILPELVGLGEGVQSFGFVFLLLQSVLFPAFGPFRLLNHRWMATVGVLSYSLYIWGCVTAE